MSQNFSKLSPHSRFKNKPQKIMAARLTRHASDKAALRCGLRGSVQPHQRTTHSLILLQSLLRPTPASSRSPVRSSPSASASSKNSSATTTTAKDVVLAFYDAINRRDIEGAASFIGDSCRYEDMIYPDPFLGRAAVQDFFRKITSNMPDDLVFIIDQITEGDAESVGLTWHVSVKGEQPGQLVEFPFGRGCSFYRIDPHTGKIVYGRDIVEPSLKPGSAALQLLTAVTPLIRKIGPVASDPRAARPLPIWIAYAFYWAFVMLNPGAPGDPIYATSPQTLQDVTYMSLNFFYVNNLLHQLGITMVPNVALHPAEEALFNFANSWSLIMLPLMLNDKECPRGVNRWAWWTGVMFLTNLFMMPWMAIRVGPRSPEEARELEEAKLRGAEPSRGEQRGPSPQALGTAFGLTSAVVALTSVYWFAFGRPEVATAGDLAGRAQYFMDLISTDRVSFAFIADMVLYYVYQVTLMGEQRAPAALRFTPFVGQVVWLATGMKPAEKGSAA